MKSSIAHALALAFVLICLEPLASRLAGDDDVDRGIQLISGSAKSELSISEPAAERRANVDEDAAMPADEADEPAAAADQPAAAEPGVLDATAHGEADEPQALDDADPDRVITPTPGGEAEESQSEDDPNPMATRLHPATLKTPLAAMTFRGVQPGVSTKKELVEACGPPAEVGKSHGVVTYNYRPKDDWRMQVTINDGVVTAIVLQSAEPRDPAAVTKVLGLDKISSIEVADDDGKILGEAFPERGVLFGYAGGSDPRRVSQVILEPLDAQTFLLRAEAELDVEFARCLADANAALELDPKSAAANAMRARVYRQAGDLVAALQAAEAAVDAEPAEAEWHLVLAKILVQLSDFDRAKEQLQAVLSSKSADALAQAGAHLLTGDVLALSSTQDHAGAVKEHQEAIRLAKTLSDDPKARRRRKAAELLIDAHLHAAYSIGWGYFQHRGEAVEKWLSGAQTVANSLEEQGVLRPELQLRINEQALAALAGLPKPPDPTRWEEAALHQAKALVDDTEDPIRAAQVEWQLGLALCDAMQIEQTRRAYGRALNFGRLAAQHLQRADAIGRQLPDHDFLVGLLFYRLGAIHAIGRKDHKQALAYYGPAVKLLEAPVPPSRVADPGRHGETFVSIAVSYWEIGDHEEAIRLTKQGVKLMEQAADEGLLAKTALAIPYGNLSNMYAEMGDAERARQFATLAAKLERPKQ